MNRLISRPARLMLPMGLAICQLAAGEKSAALAAAILAARLCGLCAGGALRAAAARLTSAARLTGNYIFALGLQCLGCAAATLIWTLPGAPLAGQIPAGTALAGALIALALTAGDGIYSIPAPGSGAVCDALIALLAAAGVLMAGTDELPLICTSLIAAATAVALSFALRRGGVRMGFKVFSALPGALARTGIAYAALGYLMLAQPACGAALCGCWAAFDALEAPFRRGEGESHWFNALLTLACAIAALCARSVSRHVAAAQLIVWLILFAFGAPLGRRQAILSILALGALAAAWECAAGLLPFMPQRVAFYTAFLLAIAAVCAALPDFATAARRMRAAVRVKMRARKSGRSA